MEEEGLTVGILTKIRKGFGFFLMSMGVSTYAKKPQPGGRGNAAQAPPPGKPE
jgi:hypothetical protein